MELPEILFCPGEIPDSSCDKTWEDGSSCNWKDKLTDLSFNIFLKLSRNCKTGILPSFVLVVTCEYICWIVGLTSYQLILVSHFLIFWLYNYTCVYWYSNICSNLLSGESLTWKSNLVQHQWERLLFP